MQHEITAAQPLLDEKGNLREAGYCKKLLPIYRRRGAAHQGVGLLPC